MGGADSLADEGGIGGVVDGAVESIFGRGRGGEKKDEGGGRNGNVVVAAAAAAVFQSISFLPVELVQVHQRVPSRALAALLALAAVLILAAAEQEEGRDGEARCEPGRCHSKIFLFRSTRTNECQFSLSFAPSFVPLLRSLLLAGDEREREREVTR